MWTILAVFVLCGIGGGLGRRLLGGQFKTWFGVDPGHWPLRLLFGLLACGPLWLVTPWYWALAYALTVAIGESEGYLPNAMKPNQTGEFLNTAQHAVLGTALTMAVGVAAYFLGAGHRWWLALATIPACVAAYAWAQKFPIQWEFIAAHRANAEHPADPAPWGEVLWGALRGIVIAGMVAGV